MGDTPPPHHNQPKIGTIYLSPAKTDHSPGIAKSSLKNIKDSRLFIDIFIFRILQSAYDWK